jgi:ribonucleoside-diphosphate reductase alpha chain
MIVRSNHKGVMMNAATNHRVRLAVPTPVMGALRWSSRPVYPMGNDSWAMMVDGSTSKYNVTIGFDEHGIPFEIWALGDLPRGLAAVAKVLSLTMFACDSRYLAMQLEALAGIPGGNNVNQQVYGERVIAGSNSAALSKLLQIWMEHNKVPKHEGTPICDAFLKGLAIKQTLAFATQICNPQSGDDFMMFMLEAEIGDGQTFPVGVYLSGRYPHDLDGLTTLLSLDMRVKDVAWIGMKLRKLVDYPEPMGDFFATHPATDEQERFPSIVAYMAQVMLSRYATLGLLDADGYPIIEEGAEEELPLAA